MLTKFCLNPLELCNFSIRKLLSGGCWPFQLQLLLKCTHKLSNYIFILSPLAITRLRFRDFFLNTIKYIFYFNKKNWFRCILKSLLNNQRVLYNTFVSEISKNTQVTIFCRILYHFWPNLLQNPLIQYKIKQASCLSFSNSN